MFGVPAPPARPDVARLPLARLNADSSWKKALLPSPRSSLPLIPQRDCDSPPFIMPRTVPIRELLPVGLAPVTKLGLILPALVIWTTPASRMPYRLTVD